MPMRVLEAYGQTRHGRFRDASYPSRPKRGFSSRFTPHDAALLSPAPATAPATRTGTGASSCSTPAPTGQHFQLLQWLQDIPSQEGTRQYGCPQVTKGMTDGTRSWVSQLRRATNRPQQQADGPDLLPGYSPNVNSLDPTDRSSRRVLATLMSCNKDQKEPPRHPDRDSLCQKEQSTRDLPGIQRGFDRMGPCS